MRIGVMLRALDEKGGVGIFTRYATEELLRADHSNHYSLFYRNSSHMGRFAHYGNVSEHVVKSPHKALWDQIAIPVACWKHKVDILFHPKFTVPLLAPCKTVMVLHGAGWFMPEYQKYWRRFDLRYVRVVMPLYCKRASQVLSVSQVTTDTFNKAINLSSGKIRTVYFGPGRHFKPIADANRLQAVRAKYNLPDRFIFTLSGHDRGQRKNIEGILKAFRLHHGKTAHKLVIGGIGCERFRRDYDIPDQGYGRDIHFPGWIDQEDLPALYSLADLYLYPSRSEAFPIPLTEAMACRTPIITSDLNGLKEIAGDAALLVNPDDPEEIAQAMERVLSDPALQALLAEKSYARAGRFTWDQWAVQTLEIFHHLHQQSTGASDVR